MTTTTPTMTTTVDLTATLTGPLHHGAGTSGNQALLRTHEVVLPDGEHTDVPYLSANSVRHGLRDAIAWHATTRLGVPDGSLPKPLVDLLWSGGAVTTTGPQVDLDMARRIESTFPALGMFGYAARSDIIGGTLRVSDLEVVCEENRARMPEGLREHPHATQGEAAFRADEFGTRHDIATSPVARYLAAATDAPKTTQMIYSLQVLKAGTILYGQIGLTPAATDTHRVVLGAALSLWAPGGVVRLGAKTAVGYGTARIEFTGDALPADALSRWEAHLDAHGEGILALLAEVVG